jgi:enoyl-CoA hydratase
LPLHVERRDRVAVLTLDDPERRNALTAGLVEEIVAAVGELEGDDGVGALVVTGAPPAFCSGADVGSLAAMSRGGGDDDSGGSRDAGGGSRDPALPSIYEGFLSVYRCTLPTVAAVNGPAVGAGLNLALACDVRVASPEARFDCRFARIGLHPGGGHTRLLTDAVGPQAAAAMVLAGESPDGERAAEIGLAWRCVDSGELLGEATRLAGRTADLPRELARRVKASLRETPRLDSLDHAVALELERQRWSLEQGFFAEQAAKREARRRG